MVCCSRLSSDEIGQADEIIEKQLSIAAYFLATKRSEGERWPAARCRLLSSEQRRDRRARDGQLLAVGKTWPAALI